MARARPVLASVARPKQARSQRTLQRLLDAAEALIEERGLAEVSVPDIVDRAGSSVGGFYARFRDKNELLRALEERFFAQQWLRVRRLTEPTRWGDAPLPAIVRACTGELVRVFRAHEALIRAFVARALHDVEFRGEALRFRQEAAQRLTSFLLTRPDRTRHPHPKRAGELGVSIAFATLLSRVVFGEIRAGGELLSDAEVAEELARSFLGYLGIDDPTPTERNS